MAITFIQAVSASSDGSSAAILAKAYTSNNTAGNLLTCAVRVFNGSGVVSYTITDSAGNTWVKAPAGFLSHGTGNVDLWYALNCIGGPNTVTLTGPSSDFPRFIIAEFSGIVLVSALNTQASAQGTGTVSNSGNITTAQASELLVGFTENESLSGIVDTPNAGWVNQTFTSDRDLYFYTQIVSATGTYSFGSTWGSSVGWGDYIAAFKGVVAPPPAPASVNPTTGAQGATIATFTVTGTNFDAGGTSTLSFSGAGITVNSYGTRNATTLVANITIAGGAALGARNVIITNSDTQIGTLAAAFNITAPAPPPAPQLVTPSTSQQGVTLSAFTVTGINFDVAGTSVLSIGGAGITVNSYSVRNATTIIANITIAPNAPLGFRTITVTNADAQNGLLLNSFAVVAPFTPDITVPLPFGDRLTACAAVFACIFIASPQGAQTFAFGVAPTIGALQLSYAGLIRVYALLINTDTANLPADLNSAINTAVTVVGGLNTTIQAMTAPIGTVDAVAQLAGMKIVVANALTSLQKVAQDEFGSPF